MPNSIARWECSRTRRGDCRDDAAQLGQHHDGEFLVEGEIAAELDGADVGAAVEHRQAGDEQQNRAKSWVGEEGGGGVGHGGDEHCHRQAAHEVQREGRVIKGSAGCGLTNHGFLGSQGQHAVDGLHEAGCQGDDAEIGGCDQADQHQGADQPEQAHAQTPCHDPAGAAGGADQQTVGGGAVGHGRSVIIADRLVPIILDGSRAPVLWGCRQSGVAGCGTGEFVLPVFSARRRWEGRKGPRSMLDGSGSPGS
jgi:hypothetical protein